MTCPQCGEEMTEVAFYRNLKITKATKKDPIISERPFIWEKQCPKCKTIKAE